MEHKHIYAAFMKSPYETERRCILCGAVEPKNEPPKAKPKARKKKGAEDGK